MNSIARLLKKNIRRPWSIPLLMQILFIWISVANMHPFGYIRGGGDAVQIFNFQKFSDFARYTWINEGEGYAANFFAYGIEYSMIGFLSQLLTLSVSQQSALYYLIFLSCSFWSFFIGLRIIDGAQKRSVAVISFLSLIYALNSYTLYAIDSGWVFTPYLNLYFIAPLFFAAVYRFFHEPRYALRGTMLCMIAITSILLGMQNLAFLVALQILFAAYILALLFVGLVPLDRVFWSKIVLYGIFSFAILSPLLIAQFSNLRALTESIVRTHTGDLHAWISWQSVPFSSLFFYLFSFDFFARQNAVPILLSIVYFGVVLITMRSAKKSRLSLAYFLVLIFSLALLNKGKGLIPPEATSLLFGNAVMGALRSYDKVLIFVPYMSLMVFAVSYRKVTHARYYLCILVIISIILHRNLLVGNLVTHHSLSYNRGETYLSARSSPIFRIPDAYYTVANIINQEHISGKLLQTPYTVVSSVGWMNLPKLKYIGIDPVAQLFSAPSVNMASFQQFAEKGQPWNYGAIWNTTRADSADWLLNLATRLNIRYLMYRKDAEPRFLKQTHATIQYYLDHNSISLVASTAWFDLYRMAPQYFFPQIYAPRQVLISDRPLHTFSSLLQRTGLETMIVLTGQNTHATLSTLPVNTTVQLTPPTLEYHKLSPTKYIIRVHNAASGFLVSLRESYHTDWTARAREYTPPDANRLDSQYAPSPHISRHDEWHASETDVARMIRDGTISMVNSGTLDRHLKWRATRPTTDTQSTRTSGYISRPIRGSIQNENLIDTGYRATPSEPIRPHFTVDGYANGWYIDPSGICTRVRCNRSTSGYSFELILEFRQQSVLTTSLVFFTTTIMIVATSMLIYYKVRSNQ